jgi:pyridoxine 5-phosphate synthase
MVRIASRIGPDLVTLVPEKREEVTTEGGLDAAGQVRSLTRVVRRLQKAGIKVALFVDPVQRQVRASRETGAEAIEINTGKYSEAAGDRASRELEKIRSAAALGAGMGLRVHAGHGLNYRNVFPIIAIEEIEELNIGHSIVSRAVFVGLEKAVREMKALLP